MATSWYIEDMNKAHAYQKSSGFTLIELAVTIMIIGILITITVFGWGSWQRTTATNVLKSDLSQAVAQLKNDLNWKNAYPVTEAAANNNKGLPKSENTTYDYRYDPILKQYCLTATSNRSDVTPLFVTSQNTTPQEGTCTGWGSAIADGALMQTITNGNCPTGRVRTVDARDNRSYWVQQLADGKCWMLTNLAYAGGGTNTYSDTKAVTLGSVETFSTAHYFIPTGSNVTTEPTAPSTATNGAGQYGYLYNWCAAMGGQATSGCAEATTPTPNSATSICPAGWRLPTNTEYQALNTAINSGQTNTDQGLRMIWLAQRSGRWSNSHTGSGFSEQGTTGQYWTSTQNSAQYAWRLVLSSSSVSRDGYWKNEALAVRCVAN